MAFSTVIVTWHWFCTASFCDSFSSRQHSGFAGLSLLLAHGLRFRALSHSGRLSYRRPCSTTLADAPETNAPTTINATPITARLQCTQGVRGQAEPAT